MKTARFILLFGLWTAACALAKDSCVECHTALGSKEAATYGADVHQHHGFSCADCHGGNPNVDDPEASMSRAKGFRGKIARKAIPELCARCHSDASLIHRFKPQQRVDQLALYKTSVHGKRLAAGDDAVATCVDCHGVHEIREVRDGLSPVHPLRLPETCARCHADPQRMAKYKIPTNQFAEYRTSVHWEAVAKRGDLSAPTCAGCHSNHGAVPPQVASVAEVCGSCHVLFANLYNKSPHQAVFSTMGGGGCTVCHSNHGIKQPSVAMLAGEKSVCVQCHEADSAGGKVAAEMAASLTKLEAELKRSDQILTRARDSGMEVSEAQMHLVDGREALIKARLAVHAFNTAAVRKPAGEGLAIAGETYRAGENALKEKDTRRVGLALSLVFILLTMAGLWLAIRSIESSPGAAGKPAGR